MSKSEEIKTTASIVHPLKNISFKVALEARMTHLYSSYNYCLPALHIALTFSFSIKMILLKKQKIYLI